MTRDTELRRTASGISVAAFTLAVDHDYTDEGGNRGVDFIDIVAWRSKADFVCKYFTKGQMACVTGRLQIRNWTDNDGAKRRTAEVVADHIYFAGSKQSKSSNVQQPAPAPGEFTELTDEDSDLPF